MLDHKVRQTETVLTSEARAFFAEALANNIIGSQDPGFLATVGNSSGPAFYAVTGKGEVVGLIAYTVLELEEAARVNVVYVEESSRKLGVFTMLFEELKSYLKRYGVKDIVFDVPSDNDVFADLLDRHGGQVYTYRYVVELGGEDTDDKLLGHTH